MTPSKRVVRNLTAAINHLDRDLSPWDNLPAKDVRVLRAAAQVANRLLDERGAAAAKNYLTQGRA